MDVHYARIRPTIIAAICASLTALSSCNFRSSTDITFYESLESVIAWRHAGGFNRWNSGGDCLCGASGAVLDVWKWQGDIVSKKAAITIPDRHWLSIAWTRDDNYLVLGWENDSTSSAILLRNGTTNEVLRTFPEDEGWDIDVSHPSSNGKYVAVWACQDFSLPDFDFSAPRRLRLGRIGEETKEIRWVEAQPGTVHAETVMNAVASDDGAYVAVAGWQHGAAVIDVSQGKCLWQKRPRSEACFQDIAFSSDNKLVYAGGTEGCVYAMKVEDGEIVSRWWATPSGKSEYGYRITTISVSADGRFVAAGTGPAGHVHLFSTKDGERRILNHGGSTIVMTSFSPDSNRLATVAAGEIKIWKLPQEGD